VGGRFNVEGRTVVAGALVLCAAVLALSGILAVREVGKQTCIEKAEARFPAVPVSAFSGRQTGPVKVSFIEERQEAVEDC
jgi:hypothetical protein